MRNIEILNPQYIRTGDLHGHSIFSDGWSSPQRIVNAAIKKNHDFVGISDHDTVDGWPDFYYAVEQAALKEQPILGIPGIEISTNLGHIGVWIPDRNKAINFMCQYKRPDKYPNALDTIQQMVEDYHAICMFMHPAFTIIKGISHANIAMILSKVSDATRSHLAIEIFNWQSQIFLNQYHKNNQKTHDLNTNWQLAPFSGTDYHTAADVGNGNTWVYMEELTGAAFIEAVKNRKTSPWKRGRQTLGELARNFPVSVATHACTLLGLNGK